MPTSVLSLKVTPARCGSEHSRARAPTYCHLSFAILPLPEGPFESVSLLEDPYVLVVSSEASPKERGPLTLADLKARPLIMTGQARSIEHLEAYIRSRGITLNVVFRSNYNGTVQGLAGAGAGAGLCARLTVDERRSDTRILAPIRGLPPRVIALAWHRDRYRSPAAQAFVETARKICAQPARKGKKTTQLR